MTEHEQYSCEHSSEASTLTPEQRNTFIVCLLVLVFIITVGLLGNLAVCWLVMYRKNLRTYANFQLLFLCILDVLVCTISCSLYVYGTLTTLSQGVFCLNNFLLLRYFNSFVMGFNCITISLSLTTMSIMIVVKATCSVAMGKMRSGIIFSLTFSFSVGAIWGAFQAVLSGKLLPSMTQGEPYLPMMKISDIAGWVIIMLDVFVILASYLYMYIKKKLSLTIVQSFEGQPQDGDAETSDILSLKTHILMVSTFLVTHIPAMIFCFYHFSTETEMNIAYFMPLVCMYYCGSAVNPCIYLGTSPTYRRWILAALPKSVCVMN